VRIARVDLIPLRLPLGRVLTLPRGASRTLEEGKQVLLVRLETGEGLVGWGEAGPSRRWSAETLESARTSLESYLIPAVLAADPRDLAGLHALMDRELAPGYDRGQPIAKAALDLACHDLTAKAEGVPVASLLGATEPRELTLASLVSAPNPEAAAAQVAAARAQGYRAFKVKVGAHPPDHDVAVARAVVEAAAGGTVWVDANQGYGLGAARRTGEESGARSRRPVPARAPRSPASRARGGSANESLRSSKDLQFEDYRIFHADGRGPLNRPRPCGLSQERPVLSPPRGLRVRLSGRRGSPGWFSRGIRRRLRLLPLLRRRFARWGRGPAGTRAPHDHEAAPLGCNEHEPRAFFRSWR
jgi:hypothetical protein